MQKKIVQRIESELHCHGLVENLVEKCCFPDLTSLLMDVYLFLFKNRISRLEKASGFNRSKTCPYYNIGQFLIVESRDLFLKRQTDS